MHKVFVGAALGCALVMGAAGTAHAKETKYTPGAPVNAAGLTVAAREGNVHDGEKLWVKLLLTNNSDKIVLFDRNMIQVKTADGDVTSRIAPVTGKGDVFIVKPRDKQNLYVEFAAHSGQPVEVLLRGAFGLDLRPIEIPSMKLTPGG